MRIGTTTVTGTTVFHIGSHTTVTHQHCHSIGLFLIIATIRIVIQHIVPVVVVLFKIGCHGLACGIMIGIINRALSLTVRRHLVIVQHLGHGCGHTTCQTLGAARIGGTHIIIGSGLVPPCSEQGFYFCGIYGRIGSSGSQLNVVLDSIVDDCTGSIEPPLEVLVTTLTVF